MKYDDTYGEKRQPLWRVESNHARVTIFNGGHEMIPEAIFTWLGRQVKS